MQRSPCRKDQVFHRTLSHTVTSMVLVMIIPELALLRIRLFLTLGMRWKIWIPCKMLINRFMIERASIIFQKIMKMLMIRNLEISLRNLQFNLFRINMTLIFISTFLCKTLKKSRFKLDILSKPLPSTHQHLVKQLKMYHPRKRLLKQFLLKNSSDRLKIPESITIFWLMLATKTTSQWKTRPHPRYSLTLSKTSQSHLTTPRDSRMISL